MGLKHEGEDGKTIDKIASAIRDPSGAKVTVLPVQFSSSGSGAVQLPLFRVEGKDGAVRFVDNQGGRYADFATWNRENRLPPGNMTYPRDGELSGKNGRAVLDSGNTPRTPDSFGEHVEQALDKAALFGGVVAGGAMVFGSGGTAAPAVAAGRRGLVRLARGGGGRGAAGARSRPVGQSGIPHGAVQHRGGRGQHPALRPPGVSGAVRQGGGGRPVLDQR